jgi:O-acetyl-ADP-ribose deacetylase (regulator of RNase III)
MIESRHGDILDAPADALVNTVNCVGVMGRGVALQFKKAFPQNFKAYEAACKRGEVRPGSMFVFETGNVTGPRFVINFPTKRHWKGNSRIEDIDSGLLALVSEVKARGIRSIAIPPLGCGLGGLQWEVVRPRIQQAFQPLADVVTYIFDPAGAPAPAQMVNSPEPVTITPGRAILIKLIAKYLDAVMDPFVTLLEVHKLMYFMQEAGESLRLKYAKGPYGPYALNLRPVLTRMDGHLLTGYGDAADTPDRPLELMPGAVESASDFLRDYPLTELRAARVVNLINGFETPFGMELLATVHWVCAKEGAQSDSAAVAATHAWNHRKRAFTPDQISLARQVLIQQNWLQ